MNFNSNQDLDERLEKGPDEVADALEFWRRMTLEREKKEALLYIKYKGENIDRSATEIKAWIHCDNERYDLVLNELKAEANYQRLLERHLANKKRADLRTAF